LIATRADKIGRSDGTPSTHSWNEKASVFVTILACQHCSSAFLLFIGSKNLVTRHQYNRKMPLRRDKGTSTRPVPPNLEKYKYAELARRLSCFLLSRTLPHLRFTRLRYNSATLPVFVALPLSLVSSTMLYDYDPTGLEHTVCL
jgi:hypothetical protein